MKPLMRPSDLVILLFVGLTVVACQPQPQTPETGGGFQVTVIAPTVDPAYPAPQQQGPYPAVEATPTQQPATDDPASPITPDPSLASVTGAIFWRLDGEPTPIGNQVLYLASILKDDQGQERAAALDRQAAPRAVTSADGKFTFINVTPGRYGLIMDTVIESYLLNDPGSGESLLLTIEGNPAIDLGELVFDDLPLPRP